LCFDEHGMPKDFYYPFVGYENHVGRGSAHKIGVRADGELSWLYDGSWAITIGYERDSMVSHITARNDALGLELVFTDTVYNEKNIFLRQVAVRNMRAHRREVQIFFNQQFFIHGTNFANTVYALKDQSAIIHYKGRRVFLVSGMHKNAYFDDYAVGLAGIEGQEGTWRDAEDGALSRNAIEHGAVDSTIAFTCAVASKAKANISYWITIGETLKEVKALHDTVLERTPDHIRASTTDYWKAWLSKRKFVFYGLSGAAADLFQKSLLIVRAHTDEHGGIIASGDSDILQFGRDTYSYVWPRDGAFAALALDKAGYFHVGERFYEFCNESLTEEGFLLHKYNADRSLGSSWHPWVRDGKPQLAIQQDETALPLVLLWEHYELTRDLEYIERIYNSFIKRAGHFLLYYRDKKTGLPLPSYDIWEERYGIHCFTTASVYGALVAAYRFAELLGKEDERDLYKTAAEDMSRAIAECFYDELKGYFIRSLWIENGEFIKDTTLDASAAYGVFRFGVIASDDERLQSAFLRAKEQLGRDMKDGEGIARYEGDRFYRMVAEGPGNPWFVTTLWHAEYQIAMAKSEEDLAVAKQTLEWVAKHARHAGILPEQIRPDTGEGLSVAPLVWSHVQYILTIIAYLEKLEKLGICKTCYPVRV